MSFNFTPSQIAAIDQVHVRSTELLGQLVGEVRKDMQRHRADGTEMDEVKGVSTLAATMHASFGGGEGLNASVAMLLAAAIWKLATQEEAEARREEEL